MKTKTKPTHIYTLKGERGVEPRWIEIRDEYAGDFNLRELNLYAAAPDLLAALNEVYKIIDAGGIHWDHPTAKIVRAAIAKAEK